MSNAPSSASPCVCSQWTRRLRGLVVVDGVDRVERLDVEVGVVRELVVEHRLRPEHARRVIDGDEPVQPHQQVQPAQQVLAGAEHAALRRRGLHQQRDLGAADGVTLAVGQRRRAPADHVGVGHGRVTRGGDDGVAPRRVRQPDRPRAVEAGRHIRAARGHAPRRRREREHLVDRRGERTAEADVADLHDRLVEEGPHASFNRRGRRPRRPGSARDCTYNRPHVRDRPLRKARRLLPREAVRPGDEHARQRAGPLRLQGPGHPRRHRRHDGQRQDRARPVADRRSGDGRRAGAGDRSQGRPRQPAAHVPEPRARRLQAVGRSRRGRAPAA